MEQNDETEFFPENSVSFSHDSVACAGTHLTIRTFQTGSKTHAVFIIMQADLNYNDLYLSSAL